MKYVLLTALLLITHISFAQRSDSLVKPFKDWRRSGPLPECYVSIIDLIANPDRYDGKLVQLSGFVNLEFEEDAVYLHKDDWKYGISKNRINLDLTEQQEYDYKHLHRHYILLIGRFDASWKDDMMSSGMLTDISRFEKCLNRRKMR